MTELKPCPFCGGEPTHNLQGCAVWCSNCGPSWTPEAWDTRAPIPATPTLDSIEDVVAESVKRGENGTITVPVRWLHKKLGTPGEDRDEAMMLRGYLLAMRPFPTDMALDEAKKIVKAALTRNEKEKDESKINKFVASSKSQNV